MNDMSDKLVAGLVAVVCVAVGWSFFFFNFNFGDPEQSPHSSQSQGVITKPSTEDGFPLNEWTVVDVPPAGSLPLVINMGARFICYAGGEGVTYRLTVDEGLGHSKTKARLISLSSKTVQAQVLITNTKAEALKIAPTC